MPPTMHNTLTYFNQHAGGAAYLDESLEYDLDGFHQSSVMIFICEKLARYLISRSLAVIELEKIYAQTDIYAVNKVTDQMNHIISNAYNTYDLFPQFKTKLVPIEPITQIDTLVQEEAGLDTLH